MVHFLVTALCLASSSAISEPPRSSLVLPARLEARVSPPPPTQPAPAPAVAFRLDEIDLIPEGIAYDPQTRQFFLSSINKHKVIAVSETGKASDFIGTGQDGVLESLGMKVDARRRRLWVLSNERSGDRRTAAVHVFDVDSKACLKKFILDAETPQLLNDLVLTGEGDAFITDSDADKIYEVPGDLDRLGLFLESHELLKDANGIAISPDGSTLYIAAGDWITIVDAKTKTMRPAGNPGAVAGGGIDGLAYYKGDLVAIVNGVAAEKDIRIARFRLDPSGWNVTGAATIDQGNPLFNIPTTCVIVGDDLFCLANTSLLVHVQKRMSDRSLLQKPMVLKYSLSR